MSSPQAAISKTTAITEKIKRIKETNDVKIIEAIQSAKESTEKFNQSRKVTQAVIISVQNLMPKFLAYLQSIDDALDQGLVNQQNLEILQNQNRNLTTLITNYIESLKEAKNLIDKFELNSLNQLLDTNR